MTLPEQSPRPGEEPESELGLNDPALYLNRELSLLEFNQRVLEQARDATQPLLERLRFLSICSTNLDEFFEIRAAGVKEQIAYGVSRADADGLSPRAAMRQISERAHELVQEQYKFLNEVLLPELEQEGIRLVRRTDLTKAQRAWVEKYFRREVYPVLTPISLDPAHPFPMVLNKGLCFFLTLTGKDAFGRTSDTAVLQVPRSLPRVIALPEEIAQGPHEFILLSSVIHSHVDVLFPGMKPTGCYQFRVTRNSDLWVDEEEIDDLLSALKGELPSRKFGAAVRLEVTDDLPEEDTQYLLRRCELTESDMYRVDGPVNLHRLAALYSLVDRSDLKFRPFRPRKLLGDVNAPGMFAAIRKSDILLHHPFDAFRPIVKFVRQAAQDPHVLAIKQTLYRTDENSPLVEALIQAARNGKEVTTVIELRARFDEEANIDLAKRLQEVGANVVYGIVGYKAHAKMLMVVRREGDRLHRYVHLGTGNYHSKTATAYTDVGLLTCEPVIAEDVHRLFQQMTGLGRVPKLKKLLQSPFSLHKHLALLIRKEAENARRGEKARIVVKVNSISDPIMIRELYRASQAGVQVDLIVRGVCCLRPGIPGVSENIRVRSVIGRFLEHSRVFYFHAGGAKELYCASADWMPRNLYRRVETAFPILDPDLHKRVLNECLEVYLDRDAGAWLLQSDGSYRRAAEPGEASEPSAQDFLLGELRAH